MNLAKIGLGVPTGRPRRHSSQKKALLHHRDHDFVDELSLTTMAFEVMSMFPALEVSVLRNKIHDSIKLANLKIKSIGVVIAYRFW